MAAVNASAARKRRVRAGHLAVACLLVVVFAFDAVVQLDGLLRGMHVSGQPSVGASDLASFAPDRVRDVWEAHAQAEARRGFASYEIVAFLHFAVDSVFALALGALLYVTAGLMRLDKWAVVWAQGAAVAYLIADLVENVSALLFVYDKGRVGWLILPASVLKWLAVAVAVAVIAGQTIKSWRAQSDQRKSELRDLAHVLRVLVIVAPVFAFAMIAHPQIPDLIRRWTPFQLLTALVCALFLAATIWLIARALIARKEPWKRLQCAWFVVGIIGGLAFIQCAWTAIQWWRGSSWDLGWGLLIPFAITLLATAFGAIFGGKSHPRYRPELGAWTRMLPALLAAIVPIGLGLGALRASFGESVFTGQLWDVSGILSGADQQLHPLALIAFALLMPVLAWALFSLLVRIEPPPAPDEDAAAAAPQPAPGQAAAEDQGGGLARLREGVTATRVRWLVLVLFAAAVELVFLIVVFANVHSFAETVGGIAALAIFFALLAMIAGAIVWVSDAVAYPQPLPGKTSPVLLILVAWFLIAAQIDAHGPHDIRIVASAERADGPRWGEAWACWLIKNGLDQPLHRRCPFAASEFRYRSPAAKGGVPLLVVATSGGATRAAYWTSTVLDCVFEVAGDEGAGCAENAPRVAAGDFRRSNTIFALSGISGGSAGHATYAAHLAERADIGTGGDWIDERLDRDFLSPAISWSTFVEFPQSFLRFRHPVDSAEVLERSWERAWGEGRARGDWGLFELWRTHQVTPLLLLNGTSVEDGCRFNGSVLDASVETLVAREGKPPLRRFHDCRATGPFDDDERKPARDRVLPKSVLGATRDLTDFLCNERLDTRLSTIAILSARFPYVSPSGRLERRCTDEDKGNKVTYVVDGGYLETSGASPIVELFDKLDPVIRGYNRRAGAQACVIPLMIQIDNGYEDDAAPRARKRPTELFVPPLTLVATRGARAAQAKAQAALLFDRPFQGATLDGAPLADRYTHFVIQTHAGARAPLGWALSATARQALRDQLTQPKNAAALRDVRRWIRPGALDCTTTASPDQPDQAMQP